MPFAFDERPVRFRQDARLWHEGNQLAPFRCTYHRRIDRDQVPCVQNTDKLMSRTGKPMEHNRLNRCLYEMCQNCLLSRPRMHRNESGGTLETAKNRFERFLLYVSGCLASPRKVEADFPY